MPVEILVKIIFSRLLFVDGCGFPEYQGDGYCDDANNNEGCAFDGGDCCGDNVLTDWCTQCECLEGEGEWSDFCKHIFVDFSLSLKCKIFTLVLIKLEYYCYTNAC